MREAKREREREDVPRAGKLVKSAGARKHDKTNFSITEDCELLGLL